VNHLEKDRFVAKTNAPATRERIAAAIRTVRGHKVLLDADLAALYAVATRVLVHGQAEPRSLPS